MIIFLQSRRISNEESLCEQKMVMDDGAFVRNIQLAVTTYLLSCYLQRHIVIWLLNRKCMGNI